MHSFAWLQTVECRASKLSLKAVFGGKINSAAAGCWIDRLEGCGVGPWDYYGHLLFELLKPKPKRTRNPIDVISPANSYLHGLIPLVPCPSVAPPYSLLLRVVREKKSNRWNLRLKANSAKTKEPSHPWTAGGMGSRMNHFEQRKTPLRVNER
jgi:hypothetical protein